MNYISKVCRMKKTAAFYLILILLMTGFFPNSSLAENHKKIISLNASTKDSIVSLIFNSTATGTIDYNIFTLTGPPRLIIDFPEAHYEKIDVNQIIQKSSFSQMRSFNYEDKTRIVFDTDYESLPPFTQNLRARHSQSHSGSSLPARPRLVCEKKLKRAPQLDPKKIGPSNSITILSLSISKVPTSRMFSVF